MATPLSSQNLVGKRKRGDGEEHEDDTVSPGDGLFVEQEDIKSEDEYEERNHDHGDEDSMDDDDDDDADVDSDENQDEDVYNERMEQYPKFAAYDEGLHTIMNKLITTAEEIAEIIQQHPCDSNHVSNFKSKTKELLVIPKPPPIKIALLGDTGVGKSSLLNSILDIPDLARAMGSGESCTCVATEYSSALLGQEKKFAAKVHYFHTCTIRKLLKHHVHAHYEHNSKVDKDKEILDPEEQLQSKRRSDTAFKTFRALFCQTTEFASDSDAETYLYSNKENPTDVVHQMQKWTKELLSDKAGDQLHEADTVEEFRTVVDPLLAPVQNDEPLLWPLVHHVSIGVNGSRVLENITIADLPGISDTNQVKVNACNDNLRTCHCLWIVAPVGRAIHSSTIDGLLGKYEERFRGKVAIICTRSDGDVDPQLAKFLEEQRQSTSAYKKFSQEATSAKSEISALNRTIEHRMRAKDTAMRATKVVALNRQLQEAEEKKSKANNKKWCALVETRNEFVKKGLEKEMKGHLPEAQSLRVFCISNEHYLSLKGATDPGSFQLSPEETGIPGLRRYALGLAAPDVFEEIEHFAKHSFHLLLQGIKLWVIRRYVEGANELLKIVREPSTTLQTKIEEYQNEMTGLTEEHIDGKLVPKSVKFSNGAQEIYNRKTRSKHWLTLKAFMRKNGNFETSACPKESWNEEFLDAAGKVILTEWTKIEKKQKTLIKSIESDLTKDVDNMLEALNKQPASVALEMESFSEMLKSQKANIKAAIKHHQEVFLFEMANLKVEATQDRATGFFTQAMQEAYDKCKADSGRGTVERSNNYLMTHLGQTGSSSPFVVTAKSITAAIVQNTKNKSDDLEKELNAICDDIYKHFDGMVDEKVDDLTEVPLRAALKEYLKTAMADYEALLKDIDKIKRKYTKIEC